MKVSFCIRGWEGAVCCVLCGSYRCLAEQKEEEILMPVQKVYCSVCLENVFGMASEVFGRGGFSRYCRYFV